MALGPALRELKSPAGVTPESDQADGISNTGLEELRGNACLLEETGQLSSWQKEWYPGLPEMGALHRSNRAGKGEQENLGGHLEEEG